MQEAIKAFHRSNVRLTFNEILEELSRQNIADKPMEQVTREEVA